MSFQHLFSLCACVLLWAAAPGSVQAGDEDARKAQEEIQNLAKTWTVSFSKGTIQYQMQLTLNGNAEDVIGELTGEGVVLVKGKSVRVTVSVQLTAGKYSYITRYPALSFTYFGRMTSSDSALLPIKETISFTDSLLLKEGTLCPLSIRQDHNCMKPQQK